MQKTEILNRYYWKHKYKRLRYWLEITKNTNIKDSHAQTSHTRFSKRSDDGPISWWDCYLFIGLVEVQVDGRVDNLHLYPTTQTVCFRFRNVVHHFIRYLNQICKVNKKLGDRIRPSVRMYALSATHIGIFWLHFVLGTQRHGRVVSTPAFYSGGPGFTFRAWDRLSWPRFFVGFLRPSRQMLG
jgi:hypothetical protein